MKEQDQIKWDNDPHAMLADPKVAQAVMQAVYSRMKSAGVDPSSKQADIESMGRPLSYQDWLKKQAK